MGPEGHCESLGGVEVTAPAFNDCCSFFLGGGLPFAHSQGAPLLAVSV